MHWPAWSSGSPRSARAARDHGTADRNLALNGIAVSPLPYPLLHDPGGRIATLFGIAFPVSPDVARIYELSGIPTTRNRGGETILPIPASYVIARDGTVTYAFVDVDHTRRAEPEALVAAVEAMGRR